LKLLFFNSIYFFKFILFSISEKEIEEVLCKHSKNAPCSHFLSGRCHPRNPVRSSSGATDRSNGTGGINNMGLLREACYSTTSSATAPSSGRSSGVLRSVLNTKKEEIVDLSGRSGNVVTFDLRCGLDHQRRLNPSSGGSHIRLSNRSSILKREKSM